MPKVSIITPVYNPTEQDYKRSWNSVQEQTSKDFEWILVNDGSTNTELPVCAVHLGMNFGPSVARNIGFQISSGKIITYLDIGDELSPTRIQNLIDIFEHYDIDLLFSSYKIVDSYAVGVVDHIATIGRDNRYPDAFEYGKVLQHSNISIPLGVAHSRLPFVATGGFQRGIVCGEDGVLWRRMYNYLPGAQVMFSDTFAGTYYVSQTGQSRTQRRFEMGGFAIDGSLRDNGRYLDHQWFSEFTSEGFYE
jgi:glycosyltransferase involved in cell wall biosynthesis